MRLMLSPNENMGNLNGYDKSRLYCPDHEADTAYFKRHFVSLSMRMIIHTNLKMSMTN